MTLEEQLREAASKGLASLTLYAEWSADHKTTYWTCRATPSARHGYVGVEHALDPVEAFAECLKALPGAKVRESKKEKVTAAVSEDTSAQTPAKTGSFDEWMKP
jgi:hypothetical protein